jgi:hypothetical protein
MKTNTNAKSILTLGSLSLDGRGLGVRVSQAYSTLIPLAISREGRGDRIKVKGVNAFV